MRKRQGVYRAERPTHPSILEKYARRIQNHAFLPSCHAICSRGRAASLWRPEPSRIICFYFHLQHFLQTGPPFSRNTHVALVRFQNCFTFPMKNTELANFLANISVLRHVGPICLTFPTKNTELTIFVVNISVPLHVRQICLTFQTKTTNAQFLV